jgi:hypothetical protein
MKIILPILIITLLGSVVSRTRFLAYGDGLDSIIEAVDGRTLRITMNVGQMIPVPLIKATYKMTDDSGLQWCTKIYQIDVFCNTSNDQYNLDMAAFFGKTIKYEGDDNYGEFTIWDIWTHTEHPTEAEMIANIDKMWNQFIKVWNGELGFLE